MTVIVSVLAFVIAISVLVAVHEFGHFWVARRLGFKVLRFSIGFGRPLWKRSVGADPTEYVIAAIPLGGYVKLLDEREGPVEPHELSRSFTRRPVWQRLLVLAAGPTFNFLFAILAYWVLFMWGVPQTQPVIGNVTADSHAARAGLRSGDVVLRVGGERTADPKAVIFALLEDMLDDGRPRCSVRSGDGREGEVALKVAERCGTSRADRARRAAHRPGFRFLAAADPAHRGPRHQGRAGRAGGHRVGRSHPRRRRRGDADGQRAGRLRQGAARRARDAQGAARWRRADGAGQYPRRTARGAHVSGGSEWSCGASSCERLGPFAALGRPAPKPGRCPSSP